MDVLGANRFRPVVCSNRRCGYSTQARNGTCCRRATRNTKLCIGALIGSNWDGALERMSRYELSLGHQLRQTLFVLDVLGRRGALRQHHTRSCWSNIFPLAESDRPLGPLL